MKKYSKALVFLLLLLVSCNSTTTEKKNPIKKNNNGYNINGTLVQGNAKHIYLFNNNDEKIASAVVNKHSFLLQGITQNPQNCYLMIENDTKKHRIILENSDYKMLIDGRNAMIIGGTLHNKLNEYEQKKQSYIEQKNNFLEQFSTLDIGLRPYLKHVDSIRKIEKKLFDSFIISNRSNVLATTLLESANLSSINAEKLKNKLSTNDTQLIKQLEQIIKSAKITEAKEKIERRKPVPLFSGVNLGGSQTHLEKIIKGKKAFVIDFWASWCPPCRATSPRLKELYRTYKRKGFDILTVSEDRSVADWKNGVYVDNIEEWHHIYDDYNRISSMFKVTSLPHLVLIDENGKIIKNKISIEDLEKQLNKIFNTK